MGLPYTRSNGTLFFALASGLTAMMIGATANADPPSLVNRAGRLFGFGWSDGYHACRESGCRPGADLPPVGYSQQVAAKEKCSMGSCEVYAPNTCLPLSPRHSASRMQSCDRCIEQHVNDEYPSSMIEVPMPFEAPATVDRGIAPLGLPGGTMPLEAVPFAEPIERELQEPIPVPSRLEPVPSRLEDEAEIPRSSELIADPAIVQELPPAWEDEVDERSIPEEIQGKDIDLQSPMPAEPVVPLPEAASPSDLNAETLQDAEVLPPPAIDDDALGSESDFENLPDGPPSDDSLIDKSSLGAMSDAMIGQQRSSVRLTSQWGPAVRVNPFVRQDSRIGLESGTRLDALRKSASPSAGSRPRQLWSPVRQP